MKVEYLAQGSADCPLIRFNSAEPDSFFRLRQLANLLSQRIRLRFRLEDDPDFELVNLGSFVLGNDTAHDVRQTGPGEFEWTLTHYDWESVSLLIEPLTRLAPDEEGFQWLDEAGTGFGKPIAVLASHSTRGTW